MAAGWGWGAPPAAVARDARPRDGGPGQGHTAPSADSLAGPAPRPGAPRASRLGPGRAARPQFPRGAGPGRAGRGRGRPGRAGGGPGGGRRSPVTCGRRRRASPPCPAGWSSSRPRSRSPSRASGRRAAARLRPSPRRAAPRAGPPRGEGARRHGCGTWEPAPAAPVRQDGGARPAAPPPGPPAGPRRARVPQYPAGRSPRLAASGVGGGAPGRLSRTVAWRSGPSVRQDGRAGGPGARRVNAPSPGPRRPPASASATPTGRCRGPPSERCRPPGSRARGPSPRRWAPPYAKMADVHFLLHFRPRPRPLGLDWPRQRPVASRCGTVGATRLSVGGRRGKMDAGKGRAGAGHPAGDALLAPRQGGSRPARRGCGIGAGPRGWGEQALAPSGAGTASVGRPARV